MAMKETIPFKCVDVEPVRAQITAAGEGVIRATKLLYRAPFGGENRYYFTDTHKFFFAGYSVWTSKLIPKGPQFIEWLRRSGAEGQEYALERREYGSAFHHVVAEMERDVERKFSFDAPAEWVKDILKMYTTSAGLVFEVAFEKWWRWLKNDMYAWLSFKKEHNVRVLACELPVFDEKFCIASPADIVCLMQYKKKETFAIIDIKATDKPIGDNLEYKLQLAFLKYAYNFLYAGQTGEVQTTFNWSLMDRGKSPGKYRITEQGFDEEFTFDLFIKYASLCADLKLNVPSGYITNFIDGEDGPEMIRIKPADWLKEFQKLINSRNNKKTRKK